MNDNEKDRPADNSDESINDDSRQWQSVDSDSVASDPDAPRHDPVFPGFEEDDLDDLEEDYSDDYPDDGIDYDVDPDSLLDDDSYSDDGAGSTSQNDDTDEMWQHSDSDDAVEVPWSEEEVEGATENKPAWPLGLIAVAVLAVLLVAGGGWGVMQQRAEMQMEIRELRGTLATAVSPDEAVADREARRQLKEEKEELDDIVDLLQLENRQLSDTVQGLETQLLTQQVVAPKQVAPTPDKTTPVITEPPPPVKQLPREPTVASKGSYWFVNFGSYSQQVTAENWATKLKPAEGKVIVGPTEREGRTLFRVRIVDVSSKAKADTIASELQLAHKTPKLWVGKHSD